MEEGLRNTLHWLNLWRMGILWVAAICYSYFKLFFVNFSKKHVPAAVFDTKSNAAACIVTGASSGIGKATAEALALKGYFVILASRSMTRLDKVVEEIRLRHKNIKIKALAVDLTSTASIIQFTEAVQKVLNTQPHSMPLQLLINNAGILATTERITIEGHESLVATNYLGQYILTQELLPLLQSSAIPARIVNIGSFTHLCVQSFDGLLSLLLKRREQNSNISTKASVYRIAHIYETSKLFMVMFTHELHRRFSNGTLPMQVTAVTADPGIVQTEIFRELPDWFSSCIFFLLKSMRLLQSPQEGCKVVVDAALAPPSMSGKYFFGGQGRTLASSALSYNAQFATELWNSSHGLYNAALLQLKSATNSKNILMSCREKLGISMSKDPSK